MKKIVYLVKDVDEKNVMFLHPLCACIHNNVRMQTQWSADTRYCRNEISILWLRRVDIVLLYDVFLSQTIILPGRDYGDGLFQ